jgi:hypothetical protein
LTTADPIAPLLAEVEVVLAAEEVVAAAATLAVELPAAVVEALLPVEEPAVEEPPIGAVD